MTTPNTTCLYPQFAPRTGYNYGCRCERCKQASYDYRNRPRNVAKKAATAKLYRKNNVEKVKAYGAMYYKNNVEKVKAYGAMYYQKNAERKKLKMKIPVNAILGSIRTAKRRMMRIDKNLVPPLTPDEQVRLYKIYETRYYLTESTGVMHHVDHIIPGSKGGLHHPDNLQVLTALENSRKAAKLL